MKQNIVDILKGKFLISDDAVKNWRFILFASLLAVVMIASSHNARTKRCMILPGSRASSGIKE